jgi:hypothetical protein
MQCFTYAEYLALALTKVWNHKANIPSTKELWRLYQDRLEDYGGYGKHFQFLGVRRSDGALKMSKIRAPALKKSGRDYSEYSVLRCMAE